MYFRVTRNIFPRTSTAGDGLHSGSNVRDHHVLLDVWGHNKVQPVHVVPDVLDLVSREVLEQGRRRRSPDHVGRRWSAGHPVFTTIAWTMWGVNRPVLVTPPVPRPPPGMMSHSGRSGREG